MNLFSRRRNPKASASRGGERSTNRLDDDEASATVPQNPLVSEYAAAMRAWHHNAAVASHQHDATNSSTTRTQRLSVSTHSAASAISTDLSSTHDDDSDNDYGFSGLTDEEFEAQRREVPSAQALPPPASDEAVIKLVNVRLYPFNRDYLKCAETDCGVCLEPLSGGIALSRMPCGHVYHVNCLNHWLTHTCTCPECRYELPTKDPLYEIGRRERMKDRKTVTCSCLPTYHQCFFVS